MMWLLYVAIAVWRVVDDNEDEELM